MALPEFSEPATPPLREQAARSLVWTALESGGLSVLSFGALPLAARGLFGQHALPSLAAIACASVVMAAGLWRFRVDLNLAAMPGTAQLTAAFRRRKGLEITPARKLRV